MCPTNRCLFRLTLSPQASKDVNSCPSLSDQGIKSEKTLSASEGLYSAFVQQFSLGENSSYDHNQERPGHGHRRKNSENVFANLRREKDSLSSKIRHFVGPLDTLMVSMALRVPSILKISKRII